MYGTKNNDDNLKVWKQNMEKTKQKCSLDWAL